MENKRILITGMNKLQVTEDFYEKQRLKVVPSHYALIRGLRAMGHKVEQRVVELGEDISQYDEVIVFIHNPAGFCGFLYNGLYAISQRQNCILAFDDWQIKSIYDGLNKIKTSNETLYRDYLINQSKNNLNEITKYHNGFLKAFDTINKKNNRILLSAFAGGDPNLLLDYNSNLLYTYNPNPFHFNRQPTEITFIKEKRYNFSSLVQGKTAKWLKNLNCNLPIDFYGSRKDNQVRLTEDQMVNIYAKDWFCLMPGYYHSGSGWWRARPLQVADASSILIGDSKELFVYYRNEEASNISINKIENMNENQLLEFSNFQKECLYKNHPLNKEVFFNELNSVLNG